MSTALTGRCACGAVRYECETAPAAMVNCHCRDCQRFSGSAYAPLVVLQADNFCLTQGEPAYRVALANSGNAVRRSFCQVCGSPLFLVSAGLPGFVVVMAGSLDEPSMFAPTADVWIDSAQHWDITNPLLPKYGKEPDGA